MRVNDRLYSGAWSEWSPVLLFDNVVPGEANPQIYNGWLSKRGDRQRDEDRARGRRSRSPASGFAGFADRNDGSSPGTHVDAPATDATVERPSTSASWSDGVYTVKARAVSVAGLAAADANVVDVDRQDRHHVANAPGRGCTSRRCRRSTAPRHSTSRRRCAVGRAPAQPPAADVTDGAYIAYSIDGAPETRVRGSVAATDRPRRSPHLSRSAPSTSPATARLRSRSRSRRTRRRRKAECSRRIRLTRGVSRSSSTRTASRARRSS